MRTSDYKSPDHFYTVYEANVGCSPYQVVDVPK